VQEGEELAWKARSSEVVFVVVDELLLCLGSWMGLVVERS
jgi:hypothetical protein